MAQTAAPAAAPVPAAPHRAVTTAARPVAGLASNGKPDYPKAAKRRGEQGTVLLHIDVSPDGRASAVSVQSSSGSVSLDTASREKVLRDWRFVPEMRDGLPVPGTATVSMTFSLQED